MAHGGYGLVHRFSACGRIAFEAVKKLDFVLLGQGDGWNGKVRIFGSMQFDTSETV